MATRKIRSSASWATLVALGCVAALAGCGGGGSEQSGTFIVTRTGDIDLLDPHKATAFQTFQALELVYDTLVEVDAEGEVQPGLAESWEYADDDRRLTFTLRSDARFHDGSALTSADVKASLERVLDEKTAAVGRSNIATVEEISAPDDRTVGLRLSRPDASLLYALTSVNQAILSQEDAAKAELDDSPNGTGPFKFVSRRPGASFVVAAHPDYWGGAPDLERVEIRVIADEASVLASLRAGSAQMGVLTDPSVVRQVGDGGNLRVERAEALAYRTLMLNGRRGPLREERVRQAIACALDREQNVDTAAFGEGVPTGPITSPAFASDPVAGLPCRPPDPEGAKSMLASAGADGLKLNTIVMTGGYTTAVNEAQNLQAQLRKVGVQLDIEQLETNAYVKRWLDADFDAAVALNGGNYDPYLMYGRYFTEGGSLAKPAGLQSAKLDALLERGGRETDEGARKAIFDEFSQELVRAAPWVWTFRGYEYRVVSDRVQGFELSPDGSMKSLRDTTLEAGS
jgi:peptide/nickel transport system substrate-binding protein